MRMVFVPRHWLKLLKELDTNACQSSELRLRQGMEAGSSESQPEPEIERSKHSLRFWSCAANASMYSKQRVGWLSHPGVCHKHWYDPRSQPNIT